VIVPPKLPEKSTPSRGCMERRMFPLLEASGHLVRISPHYPGLHLKMTKHEQHCASLEIRVTDMGKFKTFLSSCFSPFLPELILCSYSSSKKVFCTSSDRKSIFSC